jgi:hypothetical protein
MQGNYGDGGDDRAIEPRQRCGSTVLELPRGFTASPCILSLGCYTPRMKRGTILLTIGLALVLFIAVATYYVGTMTLPMLGLGVAGLVLAGVGASQRWERASR